MREGLSFSSMKRKGNGPARLQWSTALRTSPCTGSHTSALAQCCTPGESLELELLKEYRLSFNLLVDCGTLLFVDSGALLLVDC